MTRHAPPTEGAPTLHRCPACPAYLNHDGRGGLYCPNADCPAKDAR